eukprot:CAMPEP_0174725412 /NCGR_PEP_ID=MMETSP1094-20130205/45514_1 /TAXON_ID=156173 /ORGANISM="Chrysochromulina brevifilum, Strain UTEX LB 985" /LENGTH=54 /DNA_ID=CAMNT_0015926803 /DNA_START=242 /DNA_END=403 /DNA_ORIENTATION=+
MASIALQRAVGAPAPWHVAHAVLYGESACVLSDGVGPSHVPSVGQYVYGHKIAR